MFLPIKELNQIIPDFYSPGTVNVIAGRPGMGKTTLLNQFYHAYAYKKDEASLDKAVYISLEDSLTVWFDKLVGMIAEVSIGKENQTGAEFQRIIAAKSEISSCNTAFFGSFDDFSDIEKMRETLKTFKVVFIDKLQLFPLKFNYNEFFSTLKRIAVETGCCVVITSDLDQSVEKRQGHRPLLSEFTNAPNVADHADTIIFILRREYYDPMDKPAMAELIVAKNRLGKTGSVISTFRKEIPCFHDYTPIKYESDGSFLDKEYAHF